MKKKKIAIIIGVVVVLVLVLGGVLFLNKDKLFKKDSNSTTSGEVEKKFVLADYKMTGNDLQNFDLYFMQLENNGKNKVYSPLSIKYALEMVGEGADGDSKTQIDSVIGDYVARKYTNSSHMSFANALFVRDSYKESVLDSYISTLKTTYGAEVIFDPFKSPEVINNWVSGKTFKLIPNLMDNVDGLDYVLVNALAIDMEWKNKIQSEHDDYRVRFPHEHVTIPKYDDFVTDSYSVISLDCAGYYPLKFKDVSYQVKSVEIAAVANRYDVISEIGEDNIRKTVASEYDKWLKETEMDTSEENFNIETYMKEIKSNYNHLSTSTDFLFYDDENVKAFAKDLKTYDGVTLQYVGIMPKKQGLTDYIKNTDASEVNNVIANLKDIRLDSFEDGYMTIIGGYIPMFHLDYELDLKNDLKNLGITDIFDENKANLTKLSDGSYIDTAVHKANIDFSNEGIKAAAATAMGGKGATDGGFDYFYDVPLIYIDLTFDNPYMYFVRDKETGEVWFAGTVYEPSEIQEEDFGGMN